MMPFYNVQATQILCCFKSPRSRHISHDPFVITQGTHPRRHMPGIPSAQRFKVTHTLASATRFDTIRHRRFTSITVRRFHPRRARITPPMVTTRYGLTRKHLGFQGDCCHFYLHKRRAVYKIRGFCQRGKRKILSMIPRAFTNENYI